MATWWDLTITGDPTDEDLEHIARLVREGYTSGQLIEEPAEYGHLEAIEYITHAVGPTARNGEWVPGRFGEYRGGGRATVYRADGNGPVLSSLAEIRRPDEDAAR